MKKSEVYVPLNRRTPNAVDHLKKQIDGLEQKVAEIQKSCKHDFRLTEEPKLRESKISGVFIGFDQQLNFRPVLHLRCLRCSKEKDAPIILVCPRCLGVMKQKPSTDVNPRDRYFGEPHLYYSVKPSTCRDCGFTVVSDEWDQ